MLNPLNFLEVSMAEKLDPDAERFLKGFAGLSNKEIKSVIYLVDGGLKFDAAVAQVRTEKNGK